MWKVSYQYRGSEHVWEHVFMGYREAKEHADIFEVFTQWIEMEPI